MLKNLFIRNVALVDRAELSFAEGLNVLSGETGAGKSVILDSIDFVLGAKADKSMIRHGEAECSVRAEFSCEDNEIKEILREFDIEEDESLVISRKLNQEGKGGAKINGCAVTLSMLKRITSRLVDVHGQSEHFYLLKESNQLKLLDKIAGNSAEERKKEVGDLLRERKDLRESLSLLGGDESERSRRADILRYQIDEIERADLKEGEEESLTEKRTKYQNAEKILNGLVGAHELLSSDGGGADAVNGARRMLSQITRYGEYGELEERLGNISEELSDICGALDAYAGELDVDEGELMRVESRLEEIRQLQKKYGGSVAGALEFLRRAREEYALLEDSGAKREQLNAELTKNAALLYSACVKLTEVRKEAAKGFTARVTEELRALNIPSACFEVQFGDYSEEDIGKATSEGMDEIRFLFSANAGETPKELGKIISGGEMSRFMLAVKAQLSSVNGISTYLFDEIDAGIGGRTAKVVAEKFRKIAKDTQIIAVSHLVQIAAMADRQFLIEKRESDGRTLTEVKALGEEERVVELARLISGEDSALSLKHAAELLEHARAYKNNG